MNPITGMAVTPSGQGGWVLHAQGDVYTFGDAQSYGAPGSHEYGTAVDIVATSTGNGYTIVTDSGDVYDYGDATYYGHQAVSRKSKRIRLRCRRRVKLTVASNPSAARDLFSAAADSLMMPGWRTSWAQARDDLLNDNADGLPVGCASVGRLG